MKNVDHCHWNYEVWHLHHHHHHQQDIYQPASVKTVVMGAVGPDWESLLVLRKDSWFCIVRIIIL